MDERRKNVGFIQLVLVICLVNSALCHYLPQDVNNTENLEHHRSRRDIDHDQKICDGLDIADSAGSLISMIPFIGPIYDTAVTVVKFGLNLGSLDNSCDSLPFEDIKKKMDERFDKLEEKVERNFVAIHHLYTEIHRLFDEVTDSIRDARIQPILSEMKMFIEGFSRYQSKIDGYFEDGNYYEINKILINLEDAIKPTGGSLSTPVNNIINQNFAIPEDGDDRSGILSFNALYYGVQTYASVLSFLYEKHTQLSDYYYENGDNENYNKELLMIKVLFSNLKDLTLTNNEKHLDSNEFYLNYGTNYDQNTLIDRFFNIAQLALRRINVQRRDSDKPIIDSINEKIEGMKKTNNEIAEMVLPIMKETPTLGAIKISKPNKDDGRLRKLHPLSGGVEQVWVKYAIQYRHNQLYSAISDWTTEYTIGEKKYATIELPVVKVGTTRIIFRQISSAKYSELVGVVEDSSQTSFKDIHRDLYNTVSSPTEGPNKIASRLITNGADINAVFYNGRSPLHAAVKANNIQGVNVLLQNRNVKVNIQDKNGFTPLHIAAELGYYEICDLLISKQANGNIKTYEEGLTPLHLAAFSAHKPIVELLMKSPGINVNLGDKNGDTPLHYAVFYKVSNIVSTLLSNQKVNVNVLSNTKLSPLHQAAMDDSYDIAELLVVHKGVNVNIEGPAGLRPIHFAAMAGHKDLLKLLAKNNADLNAKSNTHWTALHFAVALREGDTVSMLLSLKSRGLDVNSKSDEGYTPLHMAVASPQYRIIEDLINEGADLEAVTKDGLTPLHIAAMHNDVQVVDILLKSGANKQAKTPQGKLFWELAIEKVTLEVVNHTLPATLNAEEQKRLLNDAVLNGNHKVLKYLIEERKYKCEFEDLDEMLYTSINNNRTETSKYLIDFLRENYPNQIYELKRHFVAAARAENLDTVKYFAHYAPMYNFINAVVEYVDKNGIERKRTALLEAVHAGNRPIIGHLIPEDPATFIEDESLMTPVEVAKEKRLMDVYGMLIADDYCNGVYHTRWNSEIETECINARCYDRWERIYSHPLNIVIPHHISIDVSKDLISKGANINARDDNGNTPLHLALASKKFELVEPILTKNADVRLKNNKNQKPIDVAREYDAPENIISNLIKVENQLNQKDGFPM